jgi:hypothetical protein
LGFEVGLAEAKEHRDMGTTNERPEFEILISNHFFFDRVIQWLTSENLSYETSHTINGIILQSVKDEAEMYYEEADLRQILEDLLREELIPPFIRANTLQSVGIWAKGGQTEEEARVLLAHTTQATRLYEDCALIQARGDGALIPGMARGALPFMAYHCALDGLTITHTSQSFYPTLGDAEAAVTVLMQTPGVQTAYVCIDDRTV